MSISLRQAKPIVFRPRTDELRAFLRTLRIKAAIPSRYKKKEASLVHYERMGGLTNKNYKLYLGDEVLVLRLPGRGTGRFINRSHERANQMATARAGCTPAALYFNELSGVKLSLYLHDAVALNPETATRESMFTRVAALLRSFHDSNTSFKNVFNGFALARRYEAIARSRFAKFYPGWKETRRDVERLEPVLRSNCIKLCACHNDLVPENIIDDGGTLQLIDWEYSGMNDPAWDIGSFLLESGFDAVAAERFIECYSAGTELPENLAMRVKGNQVLQDYLWSVWSLMQACAHRDDEQGDFYLKYGASRYERAVASLDTVFLYEYPAWRSP